MKIASIILKEYNIGCTPRELYWRMSWFEILSLLYTSRDNIIEKEKERNKRPAHEVKYEGGKKINVMRKPIAYFKRKDN